MANIPLKSWLNFKNKMSRISQTAAKKLTDYINEGGGYANMSTDDILSYATLLVQKYGEGEGALAAEMYDEIAELSGVNVPPAEIAPLPSYGEVSKAIQGAAKTSELSDYLGGVAGRLVKQVGADTTLQNAERDGAQFAWVPTGDTCAFCIAIASRGWRNISPKTLKNGHAEHIHANCDCQYAVRFDKKTNVEGYDPDEYKEMYYGADGDTPEERINAMRRDFYAKNKDEINAQKRIAYAKRTGASSIDVLEKKYNVAIDIKEATDQEIAFENVKRLEKLMEDYNSTCVSYSIKRNASQVGRGPEAGSAYMLNGKTSINVLNSALKTRKATDSLNLGKNQPVGTTYHEFAHSLSQSKEKVDDGFWKEIRALRKEYRSQANSDEWFSKFKISSYADYDVDEFMAEAFTQAKLSKNPSPYAVRALEIIDKYFKK